LNKEIEVGSEEIYNCIKVNEEIFTAGQPTAEQLLSLAGEGFVTVINLATYDPDYSLADEEGLVRSLDIIYHHIPVDWDAPQENDYYEFERLMVQLPEGKTLIHCAANYRVTAFYGLYAQKHLGWSAAQADEFRAQIWTGGNYPVWEKYIREMRQHNC
jgi:protein tyrosine phosphatase (PTP) superfamily phosphohydrolase (DUF442 family)